MSSIVKTVAIPNGCEVSEVDINRLETNRAVLEGDMRLGSLLELASPGDFLDPHPNAATLFASGRGGGAYPGGSAMQVTNVGGMIHQYVGSSVPDDAAPKLLSYWLAADELLTTLAAADPTNPRIDTIQVKLFVDQDADETRDFEDATTGEATSTTDPMRNIVRLAFSTKTGTPAGSPVAPSVDAGYVPWCHVYVPATFSTALNDSYVWELRYPLGYKRIFVSAQAMFCNTNLAHWPITAGGYRQSGAASEVVSAMLPLLDGNVRVLRAFVHASANVDILMEQVALDSGSAAGIGGVLNDLQYSPDGTSDTSPGAIWGHGYSHSTPASNGTRAMPGVLARITSRASSTKIFGVSFELAGMV